jgi:membrane protease YdiL (CAAX protease family)
MLAEKPWKLDAVARLFLGVIATLCLGGVLAGLVSSSKFSADEIRDLPGLVVQLRKQSNPICAFLWQKLSDPEKLVLRNYEPSASNPEQAKDVIVQLLNKTIEGPSIYDFGRFKDISLRAKTINLKTQSPTSGDMPRLNRLLLEDAFPSDLAGSQRDFWQIVISACFLEIPALALIALFLRQHDVSWKQAFGFRAGETATVVAYGVMAGALFVPAAWALNALSSKLMVLLHLNAQDQQLVQELQDRGSSVAEKVFLGVVAMVVAPVVEEMLFRGILYAALKQQGWPRLALWGSSTLFALVHSNMASFVPLLIFAVLLVRLYESFENLLAPIVAHSLFNAANFLALIYQDQINRALHLT